MEGGSPQHWPPVPRILPGTPCGPSPMCPAEDDLGYWTLNKWCGTKTNGSTFVQLPRWYELAWNNDSKGWFTFGWKPWQTVENCPSGLSSHVISNENSRVWAHCCLSRDLRTCLLLCSSTSCFTHRWGWPNGPLRPSQPWGLGFLSTTAFPGGGRGLQWYSNTFSIKQHWITLQENYSLFPWSTFMITREESFNLVVCF